MCHHCVVESVKSRMLSRRDFFRGSAAAAGAVAIAATAAPRPLFAQGNPMRAIDLTHELHEGFPTFAGEQQFFVEPKFEIASDGYNLNIWTMEEHIGTHIDAPLHFSEDGNSVAEIAVEELVCPLAIIDIRERADADPDAQVTPDDIAAWVSEHGDIPDGACVAMLSGWDRHADGDMFRNADEDGVMHFPGFHVEATDMLMEETGARVIAVDRLLEGGTEHVADPRDCGLFSALVVADANVCAAGRRGKGSDVVGQLGLELGPGCPETVLHGLDCVQHEIHEYLLDHMPVD
jgi:kynurenine formamidase